MVFDTFVLEGSGFCGINGGPQFPFTEAVLPLVSCVDQEEGRAATKAMLGMRKIVIADLEEAVRRFDHPISRSIHSTVASIIAVTSLRSSHSAAMSDDSAMVATRIRRSS
ncbi:3-demethylubiquinone-9 3-methyltransferase [Mycobacterium xenopi RIVM700367]|nr:3-demethylubiquinone-9 3-methyltransferase [Mycobacterium xenopi RIVM700367]